MRSKLSNRTATLNREVREIIEDDEFIGGDVYLLQKLFRLQETLMLAYKSKDADRIPDWPIDISNKESQLFCRDLAFRTMEELFEAIRHLKNAKMHRQTELTDFDREEFLEEIVDALHYVLEIMVLVGVGPKELYTAYAVKNAENHDRISRGY